MAKKHICVTDNQGLCHWCGKIMNQDWYEAYIGPPVLTETEVGKIMSAFEAMYPNAYGYTDAKTWDGDVQTYLIFRNREESFDKANAVIRCSYRL